jgi:hypothetical protein
MREPRFSTTLLNNLSCKKIGDCPSPAFVAPSKRAKKKSGVKAEKPMSAWHRDTP